MMTDLKFSLKRKIKMRKIRFRTLGCYPLTGGLESEADDLEKIILELLESKKVKEKVGPTLMLRPPWKRKTRRLFLRMYKF